MKIDLLCITLLKHKTNKLKNLYIFQIVGCPDVLSNHQLAWSNSAFCLPIQMYDTLLYWLLTDPAETQFIMVGIVTTW